MSEVLVSKVNKGKIEIGVGMLNAINAKDGDRLELEVVNGEIVIRTELEINVPLSCGLAIQKVMKQGDFIFIEIYRDATVGETFTIFEKSFIDGRLTKHLYYEYVKEEDMKSRVRGWIKNGYEII